jgi:ABC-type microcin C transport system permease subunit YejB
MSKTEPKPNVSASLWPQSKLDRIALIGSVIILIGNVLGLVAFSFGSGYHYREHDATDIILDVLGIVIWLGLLTSFRRYLLPICAMLALHTGDLLVSIASRLPAEWHTAIGATVAALMLSSAIACVLYLARWLLGRRTGEARS